MSRFLVVGGGIAGLVTARRLALAGASVVLFEASDRLGGTVSSHTVGGIVLDSGAESFATRRGTVAALARELGLGDDIVEPTPDGAWLQRPDGAVKLPATSLLGIPAFPIAADVIAAVGTRTALRAYLDRLLPAPVGGKATSLGEFVRIRMGAGMVEKLVAPVTNGVHSAHPDDLELDRVAPGLRKATRRESSLARGVLDLRASAPAGSAVAGIRGGVHRLASELVADLERLGVDLRLGERVERVTVGSVTTRGETLGGTVVVAAPGIAGASATRGSGESVRVVIATLVVDDARLDAAPRGSGVLVAAGVRGIRAKALTHSTAKWKWLAEAAGGKHVLRLSYEPVNAIELRMTARQDAATILGIDLPASSVLDFDRVEWSRPAPQPEAVQGVTLVGEATSGTGLANVIAQATAAAEQLLADAPGTPTIDPEPPLEP